VYRIFDSPFSAPGTHGFAPTLNLLYSSGTGNGVVGVGWSLAGLSSITRAGQTPAQDGARRAVRYDGGDRFALDANRLVVVAGTYGEPGSSYRTEIDSYQYVGVVFEDGIDGPAGFVAKTKHGRVLEYGSVSGRIFPAPGANVVRAWALDRVTDPVGNAYTIEYANDPQTGAYYPATIAYTGNATTACRRSVTFVREARSDVEPRFEGGFAVHPTERIRAIATAVDDKTCPPTRSTTSKVVPPGGAASPRSPARTRQAYLSHRRRSRTRTSNSPDSRRPSQPPRLTSAQSVRSTWAAADTATCS
jgi:hypothetical protein